MYFREQLMVFYNDADIIADRYLGVGGIGLMISHWLTQFFILEYAGAIITAVLGALAALMLWTSLPKTSRSLLLLPLFALPIIFQCDALFDVYYYYQGYVGFFLFALFSLVYRLIADHTENMNYRMCSAVVLAILLFYIAFCLTVRFAPYDHHSSPFSNYIFPA